MIPFLIISAFLKCAIAKVGFMKNNISQGFEALARAQCLLRSKISLEKMTLLSQVNLDFTSIGLPLPVRNVRLLPCYSHGSKNEKR